MTGLSYFESRLRIDFNNFEEIKKTIQLCQDLGIKNIILEPKNELKKINSELKDKIATLSSINIFYRLTVKPESLNDFKKSMKLLNNFPDILSIESSNKEVQLHAARDSRVDLISFSDQINLRSINQGVISLSKQNNSFIEFSMAPLMVNNKSTQSKFLRTLYRGVHMANNLNANIIINGNFDILSDMRNPRALISLCVTLLGFSINKSKSFFSNQVIELLNRCNNRKNREIIEPGIKLIHEEM